jgi:aminopeptidase N
MIKHLTTVLLLSITLISCDSNTENQKTTTNNETKPIVMETNDPHTFAKPDEVVVKHLDWSANVDFDSSMITATAKWTIENKTGASEVIFDTKGLKIDYVTIGNNDELGTFILEPEIKYMGQKLVVSITPNTDIVRIYYRTTEKSDALQWLTKEQTADKTYPFLFTQSQAILARTWIPCQDSPGIRFTYNARVKVPSQMMALMSAYNPTDTMVNGMYDFQMEYAIPSYLMALSVGNLKYQSVGRNTGIYAEPSMLAKSVAEFEDMQEMVDSAEALYGAYRWGKYDVLVLPPSFPFGGMENPRLTFATPTILAGDKSLTSLIAHELAHSWSGNLVTNYNWNDFWLNEGFTVYFENRIMEQVYGADYANMLALISYQDLQSEIEDFGKESPRTKLKLDLAGQDPDEGMTSIAYDKGFYLLKLIEQTVGRKEFNSFLKTYFNTYAFKSMTTEGFVEYINKELLSKNAKWQETVNLNEWIYNPGLPANCPKIVSDRFEKVEVELAKWKDGASPASLATSKWSTHEWLHFLRNLPETMSQEQMTTLDKTFGFTKSGNSEILAAWFVKVIPNNYKEAKPAIESFLVSVGRRKFLTPIYKSLITADPSKAAAREIYKKARPNYHAVAVQTMDDLLDWNQN